MENGSEMPAALKILEEAGIPARRMDYDYAERGGTREAALRLGIDEHAVVKSLVFDNGKEGAERRAVMVLMHGMKGFLCASLSGFPELAVLPRRLLMWRGN